MIRRFVRAFRAYWSVEAIAARLDRLAERLRSWPWPPGEDRARGAHHPPERIPPPELRRPPAKQSASPPARPAPRRAGPRLRTAPQLRVAASFTELENGNWLWRAQLEDAPDFFMVGVAGSALEAKREAGESAQMLERRRQEWQL